MELYRVAHLTFAYPNCEMKDLQKGMKEHKKPVLHDCSFRVEEGSFVTLCGGTGSGKTTLLRLLKKELQPAGMVGGDIDYRGSALADYAYGDTAAEIGFVMQDPEDQPVTDRVWHELAFGLENMGTASEEIRRRVAEISAYFGIDDWYEKEVDELSGGQKQLLNLAAVMVMRPRVLLLDEPTAQLDPIAAQNFMNILVRLNRELGMTIILAEHRLEEALAISDHVIVLQDGMIFHQGTPQQIAACVGETETIYEAMPCAVRLYRALKSNDNITDVPITLTQGRRWLQKRYAPVWESVMQMKDTNGKEDVSAKMVSEKISSAKMSSAKRQKDIKPALECRNIWFHYKKTRDIICGISFQMQQGEIVSLFGSNGSGKTTLLHVLAGILKPNTGTVHVLTERVGYLPQQVESLFVADTVEEELRLAGAEPSVRLAEYGQVHPYDLSGGEKQLLAWEKVLAGKPGLLLLDEPTKGLDASARREVGDRLRALKKDGVSVLMVTHDIELAAAVSDRCGMLFRGELLALDGTRAFFHGNRFYTTAAARISQDLFDGVLTQEDLIGKCLALDEPESACDYDDGPHKTGAGE